MYEDLVAEKQGMLKHVPEQYITQNTCDKAVDRWPLLLKYMPD